jgi:DnaJ-domain-containing protein 1
VVSIVREGDAIYLEMSIKRGNGLYTVEQPLFAEAVISQLVEIARRQERHREAPRPQEQKRPGKTTPSVATETHKTAYETLNLGPGADRETIRIAYREMAKLYHPDKVASLAPEFRELAELRMKKINAAYQELRQ